MKISTKNFMMNKITKFQTKPLFTTALYGSILEPGAKGKMLIHPLVLALRVLLFSPPPAGGGVSLVLENSLCLAFAFSIWRIT